MSGLASEARALRTEGLLVREISERLGVPQSTVSSWLDPRRAEKQKARRERYRGTCVDCGAPTDGSNGRAMAPKRCRTCAAVHDHESRVWTQETILAAFARYFEEYDDQPAASEILRLRPDWFPSVDAVQREFGSWSAAITAAGWRPYVKRLTSGRSDMHGYKILRQNGDGAFHPVGDIDAATRENGLRKWLASLPENEREGVYATVPLSQWAPRHVRLRMQPILVFESSESPSEEKAPSASSE